MSNTIEGKIVFITGVSSGLGEATARHLSVQGATVVLGARRTDRIKPLADELTAITHIAIQEQLNGRVVDWMEKVSDEQYQAGSRAESKAASVELN